MNDDVASTFGVTDVGYDEGATGSGGAEWEQRIENMAGDAVLLGDELWWVVLHVAGLADDLRKERDVGLARLR